VVTDYAARIGQDLLDVRRRLGEPVEAERDGVEDDMDAIVFGEQREISARTRELLVHRRLLLEAARERLASGDYGRCLQCGQPIPERRLLTAPEVECCLQCATIRERAAAAEPERVRIAPLEPLTQRPAPTSVAAVLDDEESPTELVEPLASPGARRRGRPRKVGA
jgi:DnaK suppressor protein